MKRSPHDMAALRLPLAFDAPRLREDLDRVGEERWIAHFNRANYEGEWSGAALRGPAHVTHPIQELFANPGTTEWAFTSLLDECAYFREVIEAFQCPLLSVRLLRLGPGAVLREHTDHSLSFADGEVRVHVPVRTHPRMHFWVDGKRVPFAVGESWYVNVNLPHRAENAGDEHRVHLVLDCIVDDWLRDQAQQALRDGGEDSAIAI